MSSTGAVAGVAGSTPSRGPDSTRAAGKSEPTPGGGDDMAQRYEDIDVSVEGHIEVLTLRRPDVRNALRHQTFAELEAAVLATSARVLIVTGEDPAFCSGDDVRAIMGSGQQRERVRRTPRLTPAADAFL